MYNLLIGKTKSIMIIGIDCMTTNVSIATINISFNSNTEVNIHEYICFKLYTFKRCIHFSNSEKVFDSRKKTYLYNAEYADKYITLGDKYQIIIELLPLSKYQKS